MKKFFTLIAAVAMAASVNAQSYSFTGTSKDSYALESGWFEWDATADAQINYLTGSKSDYAKITLANSPVSLSYKNSSSKKKVFTVTDECLTAQSKGTRIEVSGLTAGQEVTFSVASKGSTAAAFEVIEGCDVVSNPTFAAKDGNLAFQDVKVKATADVAIIRETAAGFAIQSVTISGTNGISSVNAAEAKAEGATFNLLGQKVAANAKGLVVKNGKKFINK